MGRYGLSIHVTSLPCVQKRSTTKKNPTKEQILESPMRLLEPAIFNHKQQTKTIPTNLFALSGPDTIQKTWLSPKHVGAPEEPFLVKELDCLPVPQTPAEPSILYHSSSIILVQFKDLFRTKPTPGCYTCSTEKPSTVSQVAFPKAHKDLSRSSKGSF